MGKSLGLRTQIFEGMVCCTVLGRERLRYVLFLSSPLPPHLSSLLSSFLTHGFHLSLPPFFLGPLWSLTLPLEAVVLLLCNLRWCFVRE